MRLRTPILLMLALKVSAFAANTPTPIPNSLCASGVPGAPACKVSKQHLKEAKTAFARGLKLQNSKRMEEAFDEFDSAARLVPNDVEYMTARELMRQQLVYEHMESGNTAMLKGDQIQALAQFRNALKLDPENEFARQRLVDALGDSGAHVSGPALVLADASEIRVVPQSGNASFHFRGDSRQLLTQVAQTFGVTGILDESVISRRVLFDIENVDFYTAMQAACDVTKSFWTPLNEKQVLLAANTPENHKQFDRMAVRTFYIPAATTPQDLNDVVNALRTVFGITFISQKPATSVITVRAPQRVLDGATAFLEGLDGSRPQALFDIKLYQVSRTLTLNMGLQIPYRFQMFNIPAGALTALRGQSIQDLVNQLIASGGINQAGSTALSALLAQLQNQQNSIFSQPLATFGNGTTLFGVSLGKAAATLQLNESSVKDLEHATLRASQGNEASFRVGTRFPILNASFAPIFNSAAISQVISNRTFTPAFPSFSYEDLGLTLKAKPQIHGTSDVTLDLQMVIRSLAGQSLNGVPVLLNREYKGTINVQDGEPAVVVGSVSRTEQRSLTGIPGLGQVPAFNRVMTNNTQEDDQDELLLVITPHVVRGADGTGSEIWMSTAR